MVEVALSLRGVEKSYGGPDAELAVDQVSLDVLDNEFLVLVGPSGCGKSTLLRLIAGLETTTAGEIYFGEQRIDQLPPQEREVGFMFQGYALFKHMSVTENVGFALRVAGTSKRERVKRIDELLSLMGLEGLEGRRPSELSGGQQQRVALARALAPRPRVLLLDEPFGAVDAKVRQQLRVDTKKWQRELQIPTILVTHDQREALELGDRVAVMNRGRLEQVAPPQDVYDRPDNDFVARFIGRVNVFSTTPGRSVRRLLERQQIEVLVRPEDIALRPYSPSDACGNPSMVGTVVDSVFLGRTIRVDVELRDGSRVVVAIPKRAVEVADVAAGMQVSLEIGECRIYPVESDTEERGS